MEQPENISKTVRAKLKWDEMEYNRFIYEQGIAYLEHYLGDDWGSIRSLEQCRMFWKWWMKRWSDRDVDFLCVCEHLAPSIWNRIYHEIHNPEILSIRINPNRVIWEAATKLTEA